MINDKLKFLKVSKSVNDTYILNESFLPFKTKKDRLHKSYWVNNENKISNSLSRARSEVFNILNYNKFHFFFTQTFSSKYNRSDLKLLVKKFTNVVRYMRKLHPNKEFYYLFIPEYHEDRKNWHLHGFLSKDFEIDTYKNHNGFISSHHLDSIGWNSFSKIRNYKACCLYSLEYITKDLIETFEKGQHIYYCSRNLKRDNVVEDYTLTQIAPVHYDFKNAYIFKTDLTKEKYYNFVTKLEENRHIVLDYNKYL